MCEARVQIFGGRRHSRGLVMGALHGVCRRDRQQVPHLACGIVRAVRCGAPCNVRGGCGCADTMCCAAASHCAARLRYQYGM
eukprot:1475991-Pleurochrysis_carterae.AAC.1